MITKNVFLAPLALCLLSACASKARLVNNHIEADFFAEVSDVTHLNHEVETFKGAFDGALDGAGDVYDRRSEERETKRKGGIVYESDQSAGFQAFIGAIVGGVRGLSSDLNKTYYKFHFQLRNVDSDEVSDFYSDDLLSRGDCVYVDVGKRKNQKHVVIKKVERRVCQPQEPMSGKGVDDARI